MSRASRTNCPRSLQNARNNGEIAANQRTRRELTWIDKENRPKFEPRILLEGLEKTRARAKRVSEDDVLDNRTIFGDNLLALKAVEQEFRGRVKCMLIETHA